MDTRIIICDRPDSFGPGATALKTMLLEAIPNSSVQIIDYLDECKDAFLNAVETADVLVTAFLPIGKDVFDSAKRLRLVAVCATGYDCVDIGEANVHSVDVCAVGEYCTLDVAEHTIALMLALNKNLKTYGYALENKHCWRFDDAPAPRRIGDQVLGIFGLGKIGSQVARYARGLGMRVIAHDPFVSQLHAESLGVELVGKEQLLETTDIISNHMSLNEGTISYFGDDEFNAMARKPIFLNLGRGLSVDEAALVRALDAKRIRGAGIDVLANESPDFEGHPLAGRSNVILTPHAAFYSRQSSRDMLTLTCANVVHYLNGEPERVFKLVTDR